MIYPKAFELYKAEFGSMYLHGRFRFFNLGMQFVEFSPVCLRQRCSKQHMAGTCLLVLSFFFSDNAIQQRIEISEKNSSKLYLSYANRVQLNQIFHLYALQFIIAIQRSLSVQFSVIFVNAVQYRAHKLAPPRPSRSNYTTIVTLKK